jgi:quercetin dioxygenase-like cupin family protein
MSQLTTMPAAYAAKTELLAQLQQPSLLSMTVDRKPVPQWLPPDLFFHPLRGVEDMLVANLLAPTGHSALLVHGRVGAQQQRMSVPQHVRLHVLSGAMLYWKTAWGADPRRVAAGDVIELAPGEEHSFVVLEDLLNYAFFTPSL